MPSVPCGSRLGKISISNLEGDPPKKKIRDYESVDVKSLSCAVSRNKEFGHQRVKAILTRVPDCDRRQPAPRAVTAGEHRLVGLPVLPVHDHVDDRVDEAGDVDEHVAHHV